MSRRNETDEERAARYAALEAAEKTMPAEEFRRRQFFSLAGGLAAGFWGWRGWRWIQDQEQDNRIPGVLRDAHETNEALWRGLFREDHLAREFDRSESSEMRVNGRRGMDAELDADSWQMTVLDRNASQMGSHVLADVLELPKVEMTVEHKCVEGWSHIVTWGGARFSDFYERYADELGERPEFAALWTPDTEYYVGLDMATMMHPQTMLTYELQGERLTPDHGAPLRLTTPLKYGIKQIKRIGTIQFTDEQPDDFWFDRGYDWYSHL